MVVYMEEYLSKLTVFTHPLIRHKVSHLCDVNTGNHHAMTKTQGFQTPCAPPVF